MSVINPKMNIGEQGIEQDRTINDVGFRGNFHITTNPDVEYERTVPYNGPSQLVNKVDESSDSQQIDLGPSANDIVRRGM